MSTKLKQKQSLRQSLSPQQLIQANILQLNVSYLEKKILDELEKNPLLEQSEPEEISLVDSKQTDEQVDFDEDPDEYEPSNIYDNNNSHSYDFPIKQQVDFIEDLVQQLDAYKFKDWERAIAEEILWNLDDNGYLPIEPILIADRFQKQAQM
jgi:DNA-directed RNA polymerase specialized sigma subunit, sigma54 homolog